MGQLKFGVSSMNLGKAVNKEPDREIRDEEWRDAVEINEFFRAGGNNVQVTPTRTKFLWDEKNLYILFICSEPGMMERSDKNDSRPLMRKDQVEVAVSTGSFGTYDFAVFTVDRRGECHAEVQKGMTYIGGEDTYKGGPDRIENQARITVLEKEEYTSLVKEEEGRWLAYFGIPWRLCGGLGKNGVRLQIYRKKHQTSEVLCPFPLDLNVNYSDRFEYDPLTFIEAYPGKESMIKKEEGILITLPSAICRWQRPGRLEWPSKLEREEIYELQLAADVETDEDNFADRVRIVQRWQDTLTLEGMDFFFNQASSYPWQLREPWVERRLVNQALLESRFQDAYTVMDRYIGFLRQASAWWFADHTPSNLSVESWTVLEELLEVGNKENTAILSFRTVKGIYTLNLECNDHSFRVFGSQKGYFTGKREELSIERHDNGILLVGNCGKGEIKTGTDWSVSIGDGKFVLNKVLFHVMLSQEGEVEAFDLKQPLIEEEEVYGFGERFDTVGQRGRVLTLWQRDACEGCLASIENQSYKNVPFFHSSTGYSVFLNSNYRIRCDIGSENEKLARYTVAGPLVDFFVWCVEPWQALDYYTSVTGKPLLPPKWVFEPWAGGGGRRWMNGPLHDLVQEQKAVLEKFEEFDIPHSGFYAEGAGSMWNGERVEELYEIVNFAKEKGIRTFSWEFPNMTRERAKKLLPDTPEDELPVTVLEKFEEFDDPITYIDFTHPRAMELLRAQWKSRLAAGIKGTMVDFGDLVADQTRFYDGRSGKEMHNGYAVEYAKHYNKLFTEKYGDDFVLYTRGGGAGSQAYACQFGGDHLTSFLGMTAAIYGGLTIAASGFPFWGVDAGGYDGFADEETYLRWTAYACFCPIMRYHGTEPREPWEYGQETVGVYKKFAWLRENILPYSYSTAVNAHRTGMPMMRPMMMEFPDELIVRHCKDVYMYGRDLLIAPVHEEAKGRTVIFPQGRWISFWDNRNVVTGPCEHYEEVPFDRIPVYLREGAFVPMEMNGNLMLGYSMTKSRKGALIVTPPKDEISGKWYRNSFEEMHYTMKQEKGGFYLETEGAEGFDYILVKGFAGSINSVRIRDQALEPVANKDALYFTEGWVQDTDGTLIIRTNGYQKLVLYVKNQE